MNESIKIEAAEEETKIEADKVLIKGIDVKEKLGELENRVQLLEIIAKKGAVETPEVPQEKKVKVTQINEVPPPNKFDDKGRLIGEKHVGRGPFFCETPEEQRTFAENNPDIKTESFNVELPAAVAEKHLNDPENKKQFTREKQGVAV